jgi:hypothetical protein
MRLVRLSSVLAVALTSVLAAACGGSPTGTGAATAMPVLDRLPTGNQTADAAALDSARRVIRGLAAPGACANGACASLAVGAKPCGGPWEYVAYCPTSPDAERLRAMAAELARVERAYNERYGIFSTCEAVGYPASCPVAP